MASKDQQRISLDIQQAQNTHIPSDGKQRPAKDQQDIQAGHKTQSHTSDGKQKTSRGLASIQQAQNTITTS